MFNSSINIITIRLIEALYAICIFFLLVTVYMLSFLSYKDICELWERIFFLNLDCITILILTVLEFIFVLKELKEVNNIFEEKQNESRC
jgi:hypothetical protein